MDFYMALDRFRKNAHLLIFYVTINDPEICPRRALCLSAFLSKSLESSVKIAERFYSKSHNPENIGLLNICVKRILFFICNGKFYHC